jgi:hypothetical protein
VRIIAKIEDQTAIANLDEIVAACDGLMVARGDLGIECPFEELPVIQRRAVRACLAEGRPVIVATHMLESMITQPVPTRAEITDVANAVYELADCVMLSGETTIGKYPLECVKMLDVIARRIEREDGDDGAVPAVFTGERMKVLHSAVVLANELPNSKILTFTRHGFMAQGLALLRPTHSPIIAFTPSTEVLRQLRLLRSVEPYLMKLASDPNDTIESAISLLRREGHVQPGDKLIVATDILAQDRLVDSVQLRTVRSDKRGGRGHHTSRPRTNGGNLPLATIGKNGQFPCPRTPMIPSTFVRRAAAATVLIAGLFTGLRAQEPRLANLSTRASTSPGAGVLTAGFVIGPGANKQVLIRAIGPTLGAFGVPGSLADPILTVFDGSGKVVATNDNWLAADAATFASVGAFSLPANSKDSALVTTLAPGLYSAQVAGANNTSGTVLVEVYELGSTGAKLTNLSSRLQVSSGSTPIIGLVVAPGSGTRKLLVRASGPALAAFGLSGTLEDPTLKVTSSTNTTLATNDNWGTPSDSRAADVTVLSNAFGSAGAFSFAASSKDAALLIDLAPGNYGIQVGSTTNGSGLALVEVYDMTPANAPTVTIIASKPTSDESGNNPGEFTVTRTGSTFLPLTVSYGVGGSAVNGFDYPPLLGTVTFPSGADTVKFPFAEPRRANRGTRHGHSHPDCRHRLSGRRAEHRDCDDQR